MDNNTETGKIARQVTSLLDLVKEQPKTVTLDIMFHDDLIALEIELLGHNDWMKLDHEVPYPDRIVDRHTRDGAVYDYAHPDYQLALRSRIAKVKLKRMARCIKATIPGSNNDEQAQWLGDNYPLGFLSAIYEKLESLHSEGEASIRRIPFQSNGVVGATDHGKPALDV